MWNFGLSEAKWNFAISAAKWNFALPGIRSVELSNQPRIADLPLRMPFMRIFNSSGFGATS